MKGRIKNARFVFAVTVIVALLSAVRLISTVVIGAFDPYPWLVKIDSLGDTMWTRTYAVVESTEVITIPDTLTAISQYAPSGSCGPLWVEPSPDGGYYILISSLTDILVKADSSGMPLWSRTYNLSGRQFWARRMLPALDGGYIIAGECRPVEWIDSCGVNDAYLFKVSPEGDSMWAVVYEDQGDAFTKDVVPLSNKGYIIAASNEYGGTSLYETDLEGRLRRYATLPYIEGSFLRVCEDGSYSLDGYGINYWLHHDSKYCYEGYPFKSEDTIAARFSGYYVRVLDDMDYISLGARARYYRNRLYEIERDDTSFAGYCTYSRDREYIRYLIGSEYEYLGERMLWDELKPFSDTLELAPFSYVEGVFPTSDDGYMIFKDVCVEHIPETDSNAEGGIYALRIYRLDSLGHLNWTREYARMPYLHFRPCILECAEGYLMVSDTNSTESQSIRDLLWIARTDTRGNLLWTRSYGSKIDVAPGPMVKPTRDGGYIILATKYNFVY